MLRAVLVLLAVAALAAAAHVHRHHDMEEMVRLDRMDTMENDEEHGGRDPEANIDTSHVDDEERTLQGFLMRAGEVGNIKTLRSPQEDMSYEMLRTQIILAGAPDHAPHAVSPGISKRKGFKGRMKKKIVKKKIGSKSEDDAPVSMEKAAAMARVQLLYTIEELYEAAHHEALECGREVLDAWFLQAEKVHHTKDTEAYKVHSTYQYLGVALRRHMQPPLSGQVEWVWTADWTVWQPVSWKWSYGGYWVHTQPPEFQRQVLDELEKCTIDYGGVEFFNYLQELSKCYMKQRKYDAGSESECRFLGGSCEASCDSTTKYVSGYCPSSDKCCVGKTTAKQVELAGGCERDTEWQCPAGSIIKRDWAAGDKVICLIPTGTAARTVSCDIGKWKDVRHLLESGAQLEAKNEHYDDRGNEHGGDGASAWQHILDASQGYPGRLSHYGKAPSTKKTRKLVCLDTRMAKMITKSLAGSITSKMYINAIAGSEHSSTSKHYDGIVLDIGQWNGKKLDDKTSAKALCKLCKDNGATTIFNQHWCSTSTCKDHDTWAHCQWPAA